MPTVAEILKEHVALDVECFDRLYLEAKESRLIADFPDAAGGCDSACPRSQSSIQKPASSIALHDS